MIKEKLFQKKGNKNSKNKENTSSYLFLIIGFLAGILFYLITKQIYLFALAILLSLTIQFLFSDEIEKRNKDKEFKKEKGDRLQFFNDFILYSSLLNSYKEGFLKSFEDLKSGHLKDAISDYLEDESIGFLISYTSSQSESHLIDKIIRLFNSEEDVNKSELDSFHHFCKIYEEEDRKNYPDSLLFLFPLLIWVIFFLFGVLSVGK